MGEHTPGPWTVEGPVALRGGDYWSVILPGLEEPIDLYAADNGEANARLIAAAPDLLEALQEIIKWNEVQHWFNFNAARAAIAKATGAIPCRE
jgi:hypothetical protein